MSTAAPVAPLPTGLLRGGVASLRPGSAEASTTSKEAPAVEESKSTAVVKQTPITTPVVEAQPNETFSVFLDNVFDPADENVDESYAQALHEHFQLCGEVKKITIKIDRSTGYPLGQAYIDFATEDSLEKAIVYDGSEYNGRTIKVEKARQHWSKGKRKGKGKGKGKMWGMSPWDWDWFGWNSWAGGYGKGFGGMDYSWGPVRGAAWDAPALEANGVEPY
eukprot:CAMPEP_0170596018 /NCGR_PEP_ID=MMETSP0224-20130122/14880_1 /TAXON_ID=285029 /ORGANISM="Togula jolla, Strain CCCM 725" /LENGTH=219 /DNA_ID=CAMNT_0010920255 /DNA_START=62 /DNA_END=721 /DNA_ORIENTATION=+